MDASSFKTIKTSSLAAVNLYGFTRMHEAFWQLRSYYSFSIPFKENL